MSAPLRGLVIDLFAGGGGASTGIEAALGRPVDLAINHDKVALAAHKANHPQTEHLEASVWDVKPAEATRGRPVDLLWASPDCTDFSVAKGGKPRRQKIRSLAWVVVRWAKAVQPAVICVENVQEFRGWGPLDSEGRRIKARMGETFRAWRRKLERLGYTVDYRLLTASDYGAPTSRRRLFIVARRDGRPIVWPQATHGKGRLPVRTAAECIDWSLPCPSIFLTKQEARELGFPRIKRPLVDKTLWRVAHGVRRFVLENPRPFIVGVGGRAGQSGPTGMDQPIGTITAKNDRALVAPHLIKVNHGVDSRTGRREYSVAEPLSTITAGGNGHALIAPTLIQSGYGEREGQAARVPGLHKPIGTIVAGGSKHALVAAFLSKYFGDRGQRPGSAIDEPIATITACDHNALTAATLVKLRGDCHGSQLDLPLPTLTAHGNHLAEVRAFLTTYYDQGLGQDAQRPLRTITTKDRLALVLVEVEGVTYEIGDIGLRMLEWYELLRGQFGWRGVTYDLGAAPTKEAKVRLIGNSVPPDLAEAVVRSNVRLDVPEPVAA